MKRIFVIVTLIASSLLILAGCGNTGVVKEEVLGQDVKETALRISPDAVYELPDSLYSYYAIVCDGRYAVCAMETDDYSAEVFDLRTGEVSGRFLHYGNGPQEVLFPQYYMNGDTLYVNDVSKKKLYAVPARTLPEASIATTYDVEFMSSSILPYKGQLLALNPYYFKNDKMGIDNGERMLFLSDGKEKPYDESKMFAMNVVQGKLLYSSDSETIVYADGTEPLVVFFDSGLEPFKTVRGPVDYDVKYIEAAGELAFVGTACTSYLSACADDRYVYLLYEGQERSVSDDDVDWEHSDHDQYVFQFDWEGNFVESYVLEGVTFALTQLSAGTEPGTLFVSTIFQDKENLHVLYYDLNKVSR